MTQRRSLLNGLGAMPSGYGYEPPEGRKYITDTIVAATDNDWVYDFTMAQALQQFSSVQCVYIDNSSLMTAGMDMYVNSVKTYSVNAAVLNRDLLPIIVPIFGKSPTIIEFIVRATAVGSAQVTFFNYPFPAGFRRAS